MSSRKYTKKLRQIKALKEKPLLSLEEKQKVNMEQELTVLLRKTTARRLDQFPEELLLLILGFFDANTRLKLLKYSGFFQKVEERLPTAPITEHTLKQYYTCLEILEPIMYKYWGKISLQAKGVSSIWHNNSLEAYQLQAISYGSFTYEYMRRAIMVGVKEYTKIYKNETDPAIILENERRILHVNILLHTFFMTNKK
jgi:hypothetical protein